MLKLWHLDRSPFGWKTRIVLAEKNVKHDLIIPENKSEDPEFASKNPYKLTPVLEIADGKTIYESTVVNEYLEEVYPNPPMLPKDPWERARVRMLEDTTDQYLYMTLREFRSAQYEYAPPHLIPKKSEEVDHKLLESSRTKLHDHLARLERELEGQEFFGGTLFSLADAALVPPILGSCRLLGVLPDPRYPNLARWAAEVIERPSVMAASPKQPMTIRK